MNETKEPMFWWVDLKFDYDDGDGVPCPPGFHPDQCFQFEDQAVEHAMLVLESHEDSPYYSEGVTISTRVQMRPDPWRLELSATGEPGWITADYAGYFATEEEANAACAKEILEQDAGSSLVWRVRKITPADLCLEPPL